jgi:SAM-dependent methyltransferase
MLPKEAEWLGREIQRLDPTRAFPLLNLGSSTGHFVSKAQPWIDAQVFEPLRRANLRVVNCDIKPAQGVDVVGDLMDPAFVKTLAGMGFKSILCANVLEHVERPRELASALVHAVSDGGYLIVSGPYRYPWHPDPIDTLFRPTPEQLAQLFPGTRVVAAERVRCGTYWEYASRTRMKLVSSVVRLAMPYYKPRQWWAAALRLGYLTRDFEATCLVLQKTAG